MAAKGLPEHMAAELRLERDRKLQPVRWQIDTLRSSILTLELQERQIQSEYQLKLDEAKATYFAQASVAAEQYNQESQRRAQTQSVLRTLTTARVNIHDQSRIDLMIDKAIALAAARGIDLQRDQVLAKTDSMFTYYMCHADDKVPLVTYGNSLTAGSVQAPVLTFEYEDTTPPESNL